jgi:hypothetical protein
MEIRGQAVLKGIKGQASRDLRKSKIPGDQAHIMKMMRLTQNLKLSKRVVRSLRRVELRLSIEEFGRLRYVFDFTRAGSIILLPRNLSFNKIIY